MSNEWQKLKCDETLNLRNIDMQDFCNIFLNVNQKFSYKTLTFKNFYYYIFYCQKEKICSKDEETQKNHNDSIKNIVNCTFNYFSTKNYTYGFLFGIKQIKLCKTKFLIDKNNNEVYIKIQRTIKYSFSGMQYQTITLLKCSENYNGPVLENQNLSIKSKVKQKPKNFIWSYYENKYGAQDLREFNNYLIRYDLHKKGI